MQSVRTEKIGGNRCEARAHPLVVEDGLITADLLSFACSPVFRPAFFQPHDRARALVVTCVLSCGVASAASPKQRPQAPQSPEEPMTFYVVKGAPGACGHDCDTWIEAEGKVESNTAARFKTFLDRFRNRNLPIYFASP